MSKQSDELRKYFDKYGIKQREICEATGASHSTISNILSGRFGISKDMAHKFAKIYGFDVSFLLSGEGSLLPPGGVRIAQHHNTNTGDGAGAIHLGSDEVLRRQVDDLTARLERAEEEKARLLGIIETMTGR